MKEIVFTEDFATKKKGDKWECDIQLASQLVHQDKVAVYGDEPVGVEAPKKKAKK
jgi:hypothetical protein